MPNADDDSILTEPEPNLEAAGEILHPETATGTIQTITVKREYSTSGPIPDPEVFARYKQISSAIPDAIIEQWRKQCDHTRDMDLRQMDVLTHEVKEEIDLRKRGQDRVFLLCVVVFIASATLLALDKIIAGSIFGAVGTIGPLISYITNNCISKKNEQPELPEPQQKLPLPKKRRRKKKK